MWYILSICARCLSPNLSIYLSIYLLTLFRRRTNQSSTPGERSRRRSEGDPERPEARIRDENDVFEVLAAPKECRNRPGAASSGLVQRSKAPSSVFGSVASMKVAPSRPLGALRGGLLGRSWSAPGVSRRSFGALLARFCCSEVASRAEKSKVRISLYLCSENATFDVPAASKVRRKSPPKAIRRARKRVERSGRVLPGGSIREGPSGGSIRSVGTGRTSRALGPIISESDVYPKGCD